VAFATFAVHLYLAAMITVMAVGQGVAEATPPCNSFQVRMGAYGTMTFNALNGVRSTVRVPSSIAGDAAGRPSAADVAMISGSSFVQYGWYVGSATGLPLTTTPRWFAGQSTGVGETLYDLGPVAASVIGGAAQLTLIRNENTSDPINYGHYFAYLNGVPHFELPAVSPSSMLPYATGEVNVTCTQMEADFWNLLPLAATLELHHFVGNAWGLWVERWSVENEPASQSTCWTSETFAGVGATQWGHGWASTC
jgi:hypothetical protein